MAPRRAVQAPDEQEIARIDEEIRPFIKNEDNRWPAGLPHEGRPPRRGRRRREGRTAGRFWMPPLGHATRRLKSCILLDGETTEQQQEVDGAVGTVSAELYPRLKDCWT
ncbi:hypothetical protein PG997_007544 [Apiospora hydei]|uniref:Uncharacterized protein n=1 Tax=Apiospora hydei TaxID=1337664 RepID=A0ABR1W8B1_9PEZI